MERGILKRVFMVYTQYMLLLLLLLLLLRKWMGRSPKSFTETRTMFRR